MNISANAKLLAELNGIDTHNLRGSGPGGQIVEVDVLDYLARVMEGEEDAPAEPVDAPPPGWTGEMPPMPTVETLAQAGVETDITEFVASAHEERPSVPSVPPAELGGLEADALDFELDDDGEFGAGEIGAGAASAGAAGAGEPDIERPVSDTFNPGYGTVFSEEQLSGSAQSDGAGAAARTAGVLDVDDDTDEIELVTDIPSGHDFHAPAGHELAADHEVAFAHEPPEPELATPTWPQADPAAHAAMESGNGSAAQGAHEPAPQADWSAERGQPEAGVSSVDGEMFRAGGERGDHPVAATGAAVGLGGLLANMYAASADPDAAPRPDPEAVPSADSDAVAQPQGDAEPAHEHAAAEAEAFTIPQTAAHDSRAEHTNPAEPVGAGHGDGAYPDSATQAQDAASALSAEDTRPEASPEAAPPASGLPYPQPGDTAQPQEQESQPGDTDVGVAAAPVGAGGLTALFRLRLDLGAAQDAADDMTAAWGHPVSVALLVARAAARQGRWTAELHEKVVPASGPLAELQTAAPGAGERLRVTDAGALGLDEHHPEGQAPSLSVGRLRGAEAELSLRAALDAEEGAAFLQELERALARPVRLLV